MSDIIASARLNDVEAYRKAANTKSNLNKVDHSLRNSAMIAAMKGHMQILEISIENGANLNAEDVGGRNAFLLAATEGKVDVVERILQVDPTQIHACSSTGNTALHKAAAYGHPDVVKVLLKYKAEIDSANEEGATPLVKAARWGHSDVVKILLECGADASIPDANGLTASDWATKKDFVDVIDKLENVMPNPKGLAPTANVKRLVELNFVRSASADSNDPNLPPLRVEGWMAKQGHFIRNWKNRWFVLEGRTMYYFLKEGADKPRGVIYLGAGTDILVEERYSKPYCFTLITPGKKFILQSANEQEMVEWIEAIQLNLEQCPVEDAVDAGNTSMDSTIA